MRTTADRFELITSNPNRTDACSGVCDGRHEVDWARNEIASGEGGKVHCRAHNAGWPSRTTLTTLLVFEFHRVEVK
ncbi:hypothetical protein AWB92_24780 [Mycobacterium sp. IEC1808]|nr:hypothetical protein AWB92_24780 [Mycobacterium sp. IEC1808]